MGEGLEGTSLDQNFDFILEAKLASFNLLCSNHSNDIDY